MALGPYSARRSGVRRDLIGGGILCPKSAWGAFLGVGEVGGNWGLTRGGIVWYNVRTQNDAAKLEGRGIESKEGFSASD